MFQATQFVVIFYSSQRKQLNLLTFWLLCHSDFCPLTPQNSKAVEVCGLVNGNKNHQEGKNKGSFMVKVPQQVNGQSMSSLFTCRCGVIFRHSDTFPVYVASVVPKILSSLRRSFKWIVKTFWLLGSSIMMELLSDEVTTSSTNEHDSETEHNSMGLLDTEAFACFLFLFWRK